MFLSYQQIEDYFIYNLFLVSKESMHYEDTFKEKLKAIRDKYNGSSATQTASRQTQVLYPLSQQMDYDHHPRKTHDYVPFEYSPIRKDRIHFDRPKIDLNSERAYTSQRMKMSDYDGLMGPVNAHQITEAQIKRQDNFNHFISDLDKRIDEKEKKLCDKFKENQKIIRHFDDFPEETEPKRLQRFASTREIRTPALSERIKMDIIPRAAYDKSLNYRPANVNNYERPSYKNYENSENEVPIKNYMTLKKDYSNFIRDDIKKRNPVPDSTHDIIQKKLDGNLSTGKDGWSTQKLENIQNRIQSVLKQVNK